VEVTGIVYKSIVLQILIDEFADGF